MIKTNVLRKLDKEKINYTEYTFDQNLDYTAEDIAHFLNLDASQVFKTLVVGSKSGKNYVFVIPANCELDLKKAAKAVGEKSISMLKAKFLLNLTGYVHGGCSPIGMKKLFPTTIELSAQNYEKIYLSAGCRGAMIELQLNDLAKIIPFQYANLTVSK